jgi:hypothetical protein
VITAGAAIIGGVMAGPGGAMIGAAVGKGAGIGIEKLAANAVDTEVRGKLGQQGLATGAVEIAFCAAAGGAGGVWGALYGEMAGAQAVGMAHAAGQFAAGQAGGYVMGGRG